MQKTTQPDPSVKASDVTVQPLTAAEIQQVSGGVGPNRSPGVVARTPASQASRGAAAPGKTIYCS